jgi:hypothetical protein
MGLALFAKKTVEPRDTFFSDISYFQNVVNGSYPYPMLCFRADSGSFTDANAAANWHYCATNPSIQLAVAYVVYLPGQESNILARVRQLFGATCPAKLAFMIDMESGGGFAGPGNHSAGANHLFNLLAEYAGSAKRVMGYANHYDWINNWPSPPLGMKRATAAYTTSDPGTYQWQYYGGDSRWVSPQGYPRGSNPFGTNVDMNVIHKPISEILVDFGITGTDWFDMASKNDLLAAVQQANAALEAKVLKSVHGELHAAFRAVLTGQDSGYGWTKKNMPLLVAKGASVFARLHAMEGRLGSLITRMTAMSTDVAALKTQVASLQTQLKGLNK